MEKHRQVFRSGLFQSLLRMFGQCVVALVRWAVTKPSTILKCHDGAIL